MRLPSIRICALGLPLLLLSAACGPVPDFDMTIHGRRYRLAPYASPIVPNEDDGAPLHPAVIETLLAQPELPLNFRGHEPTWPQAGRELTEHAHPQLNEQLVANASAMLLGEGWQMEIVVSKRAGLLMVQWYGLSDPRGPHRALYVYDISRVPHAFEPDEPLERTTVHELGRFYRGN